MTNTVIVSKTQEITTLKLGMWLEYRPPLSNSNFVFVHSISNGYALLSNGLTATLEGVFVDPNNSYKPLEDSLDLLISSLMEVTLQEISSEQYQQELEEEKNAQSDYADRMAIEDGWSPPENFKNGTDDEREIWEDFYRSIKD